MSDLMRLSLSLESPLLEKLENLVRARGYGNRSEFVRDLIREQLAKEEWESGAEVLGTITLIYNHHQHGITEKLVEIQHDCSEHILAATHVHLTHEICAEMIMIRGRGEGIKRLADELRRQKGVLHAGFSAGTTGEKLA